MGWTCYIYQKLREQMRIKKTTNEKKKMQVEALIGNIPTLLVATKHHIRGVWSMYRLDGSSSFALSKVKKELFCCLWGLVPIIKGLKILSNLSNPGLLLFPSWLELALENMRSIVASKKIMLQKLKFRLNESMKNKLMIEGKFRWFEIFIFTCQVSL